MTTASSNRDARDAASGALGEVTIVAHDIGPVGGMERVLSELVLGLSRLGRRVTVIARTCDLPEQAGVTFHRVPGPARPFLLAYPWFLLFGSLAVRRWRRGTVQATGAIVLNRVDVVSVHYCHQAGPSTPSRSTWLFRAHIKAAGLASRLGERLCLRANRPAALACVSEGVADELRDHFPALAGRVMTIHNGVDTERFAPGAHRRQALQLRDELGISEDRLVALFVGGEWERKGLRPAIEALAHAPAWDLLVAGDGDRAALAGPLDSLDGRDRVRWLGVRRDVGVLYEAADAFVLPTSYETFSLVTFEAAASGLPILVTPVNGVRELLEDGRNGFVISREPLDIARRLTQLSADPQLRRRLGSCARESTGRFGWERMVADHDALYRRLAGTPAVAAV